MENENTIEHRDPTREQLDKMISDSDFTAEKLHSIHEAQSDVRDLIDGSVEFTETDKERFNRKLEQILKGGGETDVEKILQFKREIESQLNWVKDKKPAYEQKLRSKSLYFRDGAVDEYVDSFNNASIEGEDNKVQTRERIGKMERWDRLEAEIQEQIRTYKEFIAIFGRNPELVRSLGKTERQQRIEEFNKSKNNIDACKNLLEMHGNLFSDEEKEEIMEEIQDSIGKNQPPLLKELKKKIEKRKKAKIVYDKLPDEYRALYGNFENLRADEKEAALNKIEEKMGYDYRKKQKEHKHAKSISENSKLKAAEYFDKLPIDKKIIALEKLESQFELEAPLTITFENALSELEDIEPEERIKKRKREFLESDFDKKEKLIEAVEKDVEYTEQYLEKLNGLIEGSEKEITERSAQRGKNKWGRLTLGERKAALLNFDSDVAPKKMVNNQFRNLIMKFSREVREQNEDFWDLNHYERMERVKELELTLLALKKQVKKADIALIQKDPADKEDNKIVGTEDDEIDEDSIKSRTKDLMNSQSKKEDRKDITLLRTIAEEAKGSETRNQQKIKAQDKDSNIAAEDKKIAQALYKHSNKHILNDEGKAEKVVATKTNIGNMTGRDKSQLKKQVVDDIINSPDQDSFDDKFQLVDNTGNAAGAKKGLEKADQMEETLKKDLAEEMLEEMSVPDNEELQEKIEDIIDDEDYEINLKNAA